MLWEVERVLNECEEIGELPQVLLMENVPQVKTNDPIAWNKWTYRLEQLGYKNYCQDLIATDYGIPQTRNRTFMISILGAYNYTFPKPIPLKLKLKDMLEDNVSDKYYLSDNMKQYIFSEDDKYKVNKNSLQLNREIACSKTTREGNTRADASDYIIETCLLKNKGTEISRLTEKANTLMARDYKGFGNQEMNGVIQIRNATQKGYLEATEGDGIDLLQPNSETRRGRVQKDTIQTLDTTGGEGKGVVVNDLKIRKLTPRECFRLMGVKDEDFDKVAKNQSDSSLYHLAGDSIVVDVIKAIFKEML